MDQIVKGSVVRAIIEPTFWTVNKSFGVSLRVLQLEIILQAEWRFRGLRSRRTMTMWAETRCRPMGCSSSIPECVFFVVF